MLVTTLTKRMAEDLTDYLARVGRARALAALRDRRASSASRSCAICALGEFDVLVGINLLREGLDLPEVSLVAILDADKEGFLRVGDVADPDDRPRRPQRQRRVILYADTVTDSMQRAIDETEPAARDPDRLQQGARHHAGDGAQESSRCDPCGAAGGGARRSGRCPRQGEGYELGRLAKHIQELEKEMFECAKRLEFERAAEFRDEIEALRNSLLEFTG